MPRLSIDPTETKKHPTFHAFRKKMDWQPHHAFGFLCAFWGEVLNTEANESGDISDWTPEYLADRIGTNNVDPNRLWGALVPGYIEVRPNDRYFVRDWIEIAGESLREKWRYKRGENGEKIGIEHLTEIWRNYGRIYNGHRVPSEPPGPPPGDPRGVPVDSQGLHSETTVNAETAKKRGISEAPLRSSLSTPLSSSHPKPDLKAFLPNGPAKELPAVRILQKVFHDKLLEALEGEEPPDWDWGLVGKIFKDELLPSYEIDTILIRLPNWFASPLPRIVNESYSIKLLPTYFAALKRGPIANQVGSHGRNGFPDGDTIGAAHESNT